MRRLYQLLIGTWAAIFAGAYAAQWLLPFAYLERGYWAIGGEWLLILAVMFIAGWGGWQLGGIILKISE